jgi:hypothetical protein
MEGPISFWGFKEQESKLILPEHDDDDDDEHNLLLSNFNLKKILSFITATYFGSFY